MPICPVCEARIWSTPHPNEEIVCSHCGSRLQVRRSIIGIPTNELEVVEQSLSETEAEERWRRGHPDYYAPSPQEKSARETPTQDDGKPAIKRAASSRDKAGSTLCKRCKTIIEIPNPKFCPKCGAPVKGKAKGATPLILKVKVKAKKHLPAPAPQVSNCMVCNLELSQRDDVVLCPHCHNLAHRKHLIEWLRTKKRCPSCGKELDEAYYK